QGLPVNVIVAVLGLPDQGQGFFKTLGYLQSGVHVEGIDIRCGSLGRGAFFFGERAVFQQIILGGPDVGGGNVPRLEVDCHEMLAGNDQEGKEKSCQQEKDKAVPFFLPAAVKPLFKSVQETVPELCQGGHDIFFGSAAV